LHARSPLCSLISRKVRDDASRSAQYEPKDVTDGASHDPTIGEWGPARRFEMHDICAGYCGERAMGEAARVVSGHTARLR
jgi:hypothetical protein